MSAVESARNPHGIRPASAATHPIPYKSELQRRHQRNARAAHDGANVNADEADRLARRVLNAGRGTGPLDEWRRVFRRHAWARAERAVDRLVDTGGELTIRRYLDEYATADPDRYTLPRPEDTGPVVSLADYLDRHADDELAAWRARHPSARPTP